MEKHQSFTDSLKENLLELGAVKKEQGKEKQSSLLLSLLPPLITASLKDTEETQENNTLPALTQEMLQSNEQSFAGHAVILMAMAVLERGMLTLQDYESVVKHCQELFGEEALHSRFQARIHNALLIDYYKNPEIGQEKLRSFSAFLAQDYTEHTVSSTQLDALYEILAELSLEKYREKYGIPSRFFQEIQLIFMENKVQKQRAKLYPGQREFSQENSKLIGEKASSLSSLFQQFTTKEGLKKTSDKLNIFKMFSQKNSSLATPGDIQAFSALVSPKLVEMEQFALTFQNSELLEQIRTFRSLLIPQDFRIVVLGEGKRGKSSLINAIVGTSILPTRAILPETGTVIELSYAQEPSYTVEWLNKDELEKLENLLSAEEENLLLQKKVEDIKKVLENPEFHKELETLSLGSGEDIQDYISVDGLYTTFVKKVKISLPLGSLPKGMVLTDTPALNAADPFYNYLALEECLKADCLIFVLDARRPDSFSELTLLRQLAKHGRALKLIGVLTHPSDSSAEQELAKKRAYDHLNEGIRNVQGIELCDIILLNPSRIVSQLENEKYLGKITDSQEEYEKLLSSISRIIRQGNSNKAYLNRIESTYNQLSQVVRYISSQTLEKYRQSLPTPQHLELLHRHQEHLTEATKSYSQHAHSLILSVAHDIENWRVRRNQAIEVLEERLVLHLTNAMHRFADSLGTGFAKESSWQPFDSEDAPRITQNLLDEFMAEQRADLNSWDEKIRLFTDEMRELSILCLSEAQKSALTLNTICVTHSKFDHMLVQTGSYMQKVTLFLTGAGSGFLASSGIVNILALGGATIALITNPIIIPSALVLGATAYALRSFTNPVRRKKGLLQRKEQKIRDFAKNLCEQLNTQVEQIQNELSLAYSQAINKSLAPALEIMASEAINLHLYLSVNEKILAEGRESTLDSLSK